MKIKEIHAYEGKGITNKACKTLDLSKEHAEQNKERYIGHVKSKKSKKYMLGRKGRTKWQSTEVWHQEVR